MKSGFFNRGSVLVGLVAMFFASTALAQVEPTWVKEGVDWQKYNMFLVRPLNVDNVQVIKPAYAQDDPSDWSLEIQDLQGIQAIFRDVMNEQLSGSDGYPLVYAPGRGVVEVEVELLSITPWLKPGGDPALKGHVVTTLGSGEITGRVELRDSTTRELLLLIEGDKAVGEKYTEFTRANNVSNIEAMFSSFAKRLRSAMDKVHGK
jgi:hypothetical protein